MPALINITVQRAPADKEAPIIEDSLLTTDNAALSRGRTFIDQEYRDRRIISGSGPFFTWIPPGSKLEVQDSEIPTYAAHVTGIQLSIKRSGDNLSADINLSMEQIL
jgi:hypothetical protein